MLKKHFLFLSIILATNLFAQTDTGKVARAFAITEYILDLDDSMKLVQVHLPDNSAIKEKQVGILKGVYQTSHADTMMKGAGRCQLIKGDYYYFAINIKKSGLLPGPGDLLYTMIDKTNAYDEQVLSLANHFIELLDVYDNSFYDREAIYNNWTMKDELNLVDTAVKDIIFTGKYFNENSPETDQLIKSGFFNGKKIFSVMMNCKKEYVKDFFDYIIARPRLYAGRKWKMSEIFATWLSNGAPTVIKE